MVWYGMVRDRRELNRQRSGLGPVTAALFAVRMQSREFNRLESSQVDGDAGFTLRVQLEENAEVVLSRVRHLSCHFGSHP